MEYIKKIENLSTDINSDEIELNLDTLKSYIKATLRDRLDEVSDSDISKLIYELKLFNIGTINKIDEIVHKQRAKFLRYEKKHRPSEGAKYNAVGVIRVSYELYNPEYEKYLLGRHYEWSYA